MFENKTILSKRFGKVARERYAIAKFGKMVPKDAMMDERHNE